jgi:hypothetical protein
MPQQTKDMEQAQPRFALKISDRLWEYGENLPDGAGADGRDGERLLKRAAVLIDALFHSGGDPRKIGAALSKAST